MEKVLNVIFNNEGDAYSASIKLKNLDWNYDISLGEINLCDFKKRKW